MAEGDAKSVTLEPEEAYGPADDRLVQVVERTRIPDDITLNVGGILQASDPTGNQMRLTVVAFDDDSVTLDANHPLAGKALTFELQLVSFVG